MNKTLMRILALTLCTLPVAPALGGIFPAKPDSNFRGGFDEYTGEQLTKNMKKLQAMLAQLGADLGNFKPIDPVTAAALKTAVEKGIDVRTSVDLNVTADENGVKVVHEAAGAVVETGKHVADALNNVTDSVKDGIVITHEFFGPDTQRRVIDTGATAAGLGFFGYTGYKAMNRDRSADSRYVSTDEMIGLTIGTAFMVYGNRAGIAQSISATIDYIIGA